MDGHITIKLSPHAFDEIANAIFSSDDEAMMSDRFEKPMLIRGPIRLDGVRVEVKDDNDWQKRLEKEVAAQNPTHAAVRTLTDTPVLTKDHLRKLRDKMRDNNQNAIPATVAAEDDDAFADYMGRIGYRDADIAQQAYFAGKPADDEWPANAGAGVPYTELGKAARIAAWGIFFAIAIGGAIALGAGLSTIVDKVWP